MNESAAGEGSTSARFASMSDSRAPVPGLLARAVARVFGSVAALRRGRALHPKGVTRRGSARLTERGAVLCEAAVCEVLVRFSRGAGLPAHVPDVNGVAIRLVDARGPDRHRDLLFASVGPGPLRHVLVPGVDFGRARFSSVLRYRLGDEPVTLTAEVRPTGTSLSRLGEIASVSLTVGAVGKHGAVEPLATITLPEVVDGRALRFDPDATDAALVPLGFLNAIRGPAYAASRAVPDKDLPEAGHGSVRP